MSNCRREFILGWQDGIGNFGAVPSAIDKDDERAYRAGYEQGQRDRQDAEKLAKELYGGSPDYFDPSEMPAQEPVCAEHQAKRDVVTPFGMMCGACFECYFGRPSK